jgi:hypothetical protein
VAMGNGQALENSRIVNYLSLGIGLFSLPGSIAFHMGVKYKKKIYNHSTVSKL